MHSVFSRSLQVLGFVLISSLLALLAIPCAAANSPSTMAFAPVLACVSRQTPPPPIDTSEQPAPGQPTPGPLPVPTPPVGGPRMGECGTVLPAKALNPPEGTTAASWLLQNLDTGAVIAARDPHERERPASLLKTLLTLVVISELKPEQIITATEEDANQECTCVGIVAGGQYTVDQLLHGLLMHSGNDVAHAFATALGGVTVALAKMNALARRIGAWDTRAATPSGLDGPGMSTSAYDISLIFHYAMKEPTFAKAVGIKQFPFPGWGDKPGFPVFNDNKLLGVYPGFLGGKTGFTDDARHTYVGGAERSGTRLAVVMLRGEQRPSRLAEQAAKLLDYGFALAAARTEPVGHIRYLPAEVAPADPNATQLPDFAAKEAENPFGTTGWIITLVVALVVFAGFMVGHRRKKPGARPVPGKPISNRPRSTATTPPQPT